MTSEVTPEEIRRQQADYAKREESRAEREKQSDIDRAEIKIKVISNGIVVKTRVGWTAFADWQRASLFIGSYLQKQAAVR